MALRRTLLGSAAGAGLALGVWGQSQRASAQGPSGAFSGSEWRKFHLESVSNVSGDTKKFRFTIPDNGSTQMPVASCISVRQPGTDLGRPYTPTTLASETGHFDLVVKKYPTGKMGTFMHGLKVGESVEVMGPWTKWAYEQGKQDSIGMIAGGTGITPMYQVIQEVLAKPGDPTKLSLLYANTTPDDILLKDQLNKLQSQHPKRFNVAYTVDKSGWFWGGFKGYINAEMIQKTLPAKTSKTVTLVCGPPGMMKHVCGAPVWQDNKMLQGPIEGVMKDMAYQSENVHKF